MDSQSSSSPNCIGRRGFLRSLFGVGTVVEKKAVAAQLKPVGRFFWADLRTGQVGFPSGFNVGNAQPGSLMKLIAAAALLEEKLLTPNEVVECRGMTVVNKQQIACQFAHGQVSLAHALGKSCNIYFAEMSQRLNANVFLDYARRFGLDQPVAKLPSGPFPLKPLQAESLNYVLGSSEDMRPHAIQILRMSALIATRGHVVHLHSADDPEVDAPPFELQLKSETWTQLARGMQFAVSEGTCKKLDPEMSLHVCAKTGTVKHGNKFQSWVTGFFPEETPHYSFCVLSPSGTSAEAAVPVAHELLHATTWP
jgi:cell division protein FtsI/penicillin-binding protein 2